MQKTTLEELYQSMLRESPPDGTAAEEPEHPAPGQIENSTYTIVSMVAYIIGVPRHIFENEHEPPQMEWYEKLNTDKNARIVRNLCILRTDIERSFKKIQTAMVNDLKNLHTLPEYITQEALTGLMNDGITVEKVNYKPSQYIIDINKLLGERLNNCRNCFPTWINFDYIRNLITMPKGNNENGCRAAAAEYYANRNSYPYQVYINWGTKIAGNLLASDKKFVTRLYEHNEDYFYDMSKITDAGLVTKNGIYDFLDECETSVIVVDCENSDPYKLYAMLNNLNAEALLEKISKIVLYDDIHTTSAWDILGDFTDIPIEHIEIERIKENKSLVDARLIVGVMRAYYEDKVDAFILCSSDSDYWAIISQVPQVRFLVMVESEKCGPDIKLAMKQNGVPYCYLDDFCTGNSNQIKISAMLSAVYARMDEFVHFNIRDIVDEAYRDTRADMSTKERQQFYDRYIKPMRLVIAPDGEVEIRLGE